MAINCAAVADVAAVADIAAVADAAGVIYLLMDGDESQDRDPESRASCRKPGGTSSQHASVAIPR